MKNCKDNIHITSGKPLGEGHSCACGATKDIDLREIKNPELVDYSEVTDFYPDQDGKLYEYPQEITVQDGNKEIKLSGEYARIIITRLAKDR